jgi:uncharacterized protein YkwD
VTALTLLTVLPAEARRRCQLSDLEDEAGEVVLESPEPRGTKLVAQVIRRCTRRGCLEVTIYREVIDEDNDGTPVIPELRREDPSFEPFERPPAPPSTRPAPALRPSPASRPAATAAAVTCGDATESAAFALMNAHRATLGLGALTCDRTALKVARAHSKDMCDRGYFSHQSPEGTTPWERLRTGGARFRGAGENIAAGYETARAVHDGWLASPGHRRNIETASWTRAAVGAVDCDGRLYWTQLFAR